MDSKAVLLLFLLIQGLSLDVSGQYIFQNFKEKDGLSTRQTNCVYKDADGFLWVGTANGLNRFDGNVFKKFTAPKGQKDMFINAIHPIDSNENLLLGTSRGIRVFNKKSNAFVDDARFGALNNRMVLSVKEDGEKRLWIVGYTELFIFSGNRLLSASSVISAAKGLKYHDFSYAAFPAFCWDSSRGGFWIGGSKSFFLDCKNNKLYDSSFNPKHFEILNHTEITAIALDSNFDIWFSSNKDLSLNYLNFKTKKAEKYQNIDGNLIFIDNMNRIWISTWSYSAYLKMPGKTVTRIPFSQDDPNSIGYGHFRDAIQDKEGNIWLATINGISMNSANSPIEAIYKLPSFNFHLKTGFAPVNMVDLDSTRIIASKDDGIVFYDMDSRTYQKYLVTEQGYLLRNKFMGSVKSEGDWWFAGFDGVYILKKNSNKLSLFAGLKNMPNRFCNFIFKDKKGNIWFQITHDALYRFDTVTGDLTRFDGKDEQYGLFQYRNCQSYVQLRNGNLLFSMEGANFLNFDQRTSKFSVIPVANLGSFYVPKLVEDREGNIWSCLWGRGLIKTDIKGRVTDSLNSGNSKLPDRISGVDIDSRGVLWTAGPDGLYYVDPTTRHATRVQIELGKNFEDYWTYIRVQNNKVYAVMLDHVVVLDPFRFAKIQVSRPPHITAVKVLGQEVKDFQKLKMIELPFDENFITFEFASLNHRNVPSLQYSYQLEGIDEDWVNAGRFLIASYNHLPPGRYTFKVRSTDERGKWMNNVSLQKIYIHPQWWQSWWFILSVAILACLFIVITYRSYSLRKQKNLFNNAIEYFANSVYGENSVNEICWDIVRNCISMLHFEDCVVYLWDNEKNKLVQKAAYGTKNNSEHELLNPLELEIGEGIVGVAAMLKKPIIISDTSKDHRYIAGDVPRLSEIAVPILHEGKVVGVLDSEHSRRNFFGEEHARALTTIASISANKIAEAVAETQAQQKEIMLLETNKMLAESQLMALRAQMNPHFVFNCLNSIQECIVTQKYTEGSKYLNKFSKLFRMVLNNSDKNLVTIEEEKDVLELYLELEQMRFEQSFVYKIEIDDDLESDEIVLPSMLLQPYVENALWHGLMHKDGYRELNIIFKRINDDIFTCSIDDNGIGREQSFAIKARSTKRHKSKGLQIAKDRLNLIERQGQHASVNIIDKYDECENPTGTLVVIELSTFLEHT